MSPALTPFERRERRLLDLAARVDADTDPSGSGAASDLATLSAALGIATRSQLDRAWLWLHLAELWDYLAPGDPGSARPGAGLAP